MIKVMAILLAVMMLAGYNFQTPADGGEKTETLQIAQGDRARSAAQGIGEAAYHEPLCGIGEAAEHVPGGMNE